MNGTRPYHTVSIGIEAMKFTDLDSYLDIVEWWKRVHGEHRDAAAVFEYRTPIMLICTRGEYQAANPGDWIIRDPEGEFHACRADVFALAYAEPQP